MISGVHQSLQIAEHFICPPSCVSAYFDSEIFPLWDQLTYAFFLTFSFQWLKRTVSTWQKWESLTRVSCLSLQFFMTVKWMEEVALCCHGTKPAELMKERALKQKLGEAARKPSKRFVSPGDHQTALLHARVCCCWVIELRRCHGVTHQRLIIPAAARGRYNTVSHVWVWSLCW